MIGIIGGSGLYKLEGFEVIDKIKVRPPFGEPSSSVVDVSSLNVVLVANKNEVILETLRNIKAVLHPHPWTLKSSLQTS